VPAAVPAAAPPAPVRPLPAAAPAAAAPAAGGAPAAAVDTPQLARARVDDAALRARCQQQLDAASFRQLDKALISIKEAEASLRGRRPGIGYGVDKIVETDNTVFSIVGPHRGDYGGVRIVMKREAMHLPDFFVLPCAATYFKGEGWCGSRISRPWEKDDGVWNFDTVGKDQFRKRKFHPVAPRWADALAMDLAARREGRSDLASVQEWWKAAESHTVLEGHLPQSLSLHFVHRVFVTEEMLPAGSDRDAVLAAFGDRLVFCKDEADIDRRVEHCFCDTSSRSNRLRGFTLSLKASRTLEETFIPLMREAGRPMILWFRMRAESAVIVLADDAAAADASRRMFSVYLSRAAGVRIAEKPAKAIDGTALLASDKSFFLEPLGADYVHVCIVYDSTAGHITVSKWGPTEVRNPGPSLRYDSKALPKEIKHAFVIPTSRVEMTDVFFGRDAPAAVVDLQQPREKPAAAAAPSMFDRAKAAATAAASALFGPSSRDAAKAAASAPSADNDAPTAKPAASPTAPAAAPVATAAASRCAMMGGRSCLAYSGSEVEKATHIQTTEPHPCLWGAQCRERADAAHCLLFTHVDLPRCRDGDGCAQRRNAAHRRAFSHRGLWDCMVPCKRGAACRKRDDTEHELKYSH
jgi:hypothetical protein